MCDETEVCVCLQTCDINLSIWIKEPEVKSDKNWRFYICMELEITSLTEEAKFESQMTIFVSKGKFKDDL
jgi:hypothetical protein